MGMLYSITNKITVGTLDSVSTEDAVYVMENLYCYRPSKAFRFTSKTSQWIKVNLAAAVKVTLAAVFNHNLLSGATVNLEANDTDAWGAPAYQSAMSWREHDEVKLLDETRQWWRLTVDDGSNPLYPEIGELFLGEYSRFTYGKVKPGRAVGPVFHKSREETPHGQSWRHSLSDAEEMTLEITNLNVPSQVDEIKTFLRAVHANDGRFVIVPNENEPHVYMVELMSDSGFLTSIVKGSSQELNEWKFDLKTLVRGVVLL